jgi:hypothetical protein
MALLGGIGEVRQPLANPVQDPVVGRITDVHGNKVLFVEFGAAQNFLEELSLRFLFTGTNHHVSVGVIFRGAEHILQKFVPALGTKLRMHTSVGNAEFGFNIERQRIHVGMPEGVKPLAIADKSFHLHGVPP